MQGFDNPLLPSLKFHEREMYYKILSINEDYHNTKQELTIYIRKFQENLNLKEDLSFWILKEMEEKGLVKLPKLFWEKDRRCFNLMDKKFKYFFHLIETLNSNRTNNLIIIYWYCKKYTYFYYIHVKLGPTQETLLITHFPISFFEWKILQKLKKIKHIKREDNFF